MKKLTKIEIEDIKKLLAVHTIEFVAKQIGKSKSTIAKIKQGKYGVKEKKKGEKSTNKLGIPEAAVAPFKPIFGVVSKALTRLQQAVDELKGLLS